MKKIEKEEALNTAKLSPKTSSLIKNALMVIGIVAAVLLVRMFVFDYYRISGPSMAPTLQDRQMVTVNKLDKTPNRGQVVIFNAYGIDPRTPKEEVHNGDIDYVKRVIGVPGDTVSKKGNNLYVNGKKVSQNYLKYGNKDYTNDGQKANVYSKDERGQGSGVLEYNNWNLKELSHSGNWNTASTNKVKVPKGSYFVMGDHRSVSNDSRYFGYVPQSHIIGVVNTPKLFFSENVRHLVKDEQDHFFAKE